MKQRESAWPTIPIESFLSSSLTMLQGLELRRLEYAANLEKEIKQMQHERWRALVAAGVARFVIEHRDYFLNRPGDHLRQVNAEPPPSET